jgi:pimeloyl-ACP methyl ester carboxylesterase
MDHRKFAGFWLAAGVCLLSCGAAAPAPQIDDPAYAHPQRMVEVGPGRRLNLYCLGKGVPTVVFVSGLAEEMTPWGVVQPAIARETQACAYDRAGLGFSDPGAGDGSAAGIAEDLHRLLMAAHISPPYVLVGHSYGGLAVRYYASVHRSEVAGVVLVDPTLEDEAADKLKVQPDFAKIFLEPQYADLRACAGAARQGLVPGTKAYAHCVAPPRRQYSADINAALQANHAGPAYQSAFLSEDMASGDGVSGAQVRATRRRLGDLPLVVLTAPYAHTGPLPPGIKPELRTAMQQLYATGPDGVAALSTRGVRRPVPDTGHYIQLDRPEVVEAAIKEVVEEARTARH